MKERKPRTKEQNPFFESNHCWYDDGTKWKECNKPWQTNVTETLTNVNI